jgi:hypothetical protein
MPNTFITSDVVARTASVVANNLLTLGGLIPRAVEGTYAGKVGDTVRVSVPPVFGDADEFTGTASATTVTERVAPVVLEKHFYKMVTLTSKDRTLNLQDFTNQIVVPAVRSITQSIDKLWLRKLQDFRANLVGTAANRPSTAAHIAAANKFLNDALVSKSGRVCLVDTTVEQSLIQLSQFTSKDYGDDAGMALRNATLGDRYGLKFIVDPLLGAFDRGAVAGTVLLKGAVAVGQTSVPMDAFTADGTVYAGTSFTVAGDTTRYTVTEDAAVTSNAATLKISPAIKAVTADNAEVTFEAAGYMNLAFHPGATAGAIVAPEPLWGVNSSVGSYNGINIRVSMGGTLTSLSDSIVFDVMTGCRVVQPGGGCLLAG